MRIDNLKENEKLLIDQVNALNIQMDQHEKLVAAHAEKAAVLKTKRDLMLRLCLPERELPEQIDMLICMHDAGEIHGLLLNGEARKARLTPRTPLGPALRQ